MTCSIEYRISDDRYHVPGAGLWGEKLKQGFEIYGAVMSNKREAAERLCHIIENVVVIERLSSSLEKTLNTRY